MTVFGSKGGAFKEATGMWASKDGIWQPVPLGEAPPSSGGGLIGPSWKLSYYAGSLVTPHTFAITTAWEGTDLVITLPPPNPYIIYAYQVGLLLFPDPLLPHPYTDPVPLLTSNVLMSRWSMDIVFGPPQVETNTYILLVWMDSTLTPYGTGGWMYVNAIGNSWGPPPLIPEPGFPMPHAFGLNFPPSGNFDSGYFGMIIWITQENLNPGAPTVIRLHTDECEWGFAWLDGSNIPPPPARSLKPSDKFLETTKDFFEADLSRTNMSLEQREEAEKLRRHPLLQRFAPPQEPWR